MERKTIIIELVDNKVLNVSGPLEYDRELCVKMLEEALKVAKSYKSGMLVMPTNEKFIDLKSNKVNHLIRKEL